MRGLYFLAAAYTGVWIGLFFYLVALGRRASRLEQEIAALPLDPADRR
jgi:CcmD family protein